MSTALEVRRLRARRKKKKSGMQPWLIILLSLSILASLTGVIGIGTAYAYYQSYAKDYVPILEKLEQSSRGLTEIYDRNGPEGGELLGKLQAPAQAQLLDPVHLDEISPWLIQATISTEDNSFEENPGVNVKGLIRAAYENYVKGTFGSGSGGSSITQQLIKNVYICPSVSADETNRCTDGAERTLDRKLREIVYAIELTQDYTKDDILQWYLNQIPYGGQYIGIQAASRGYFQKDAKDLTLAEASLLAGIPQTPTRFLPSNNCLEDDAGACILDELGRITVVSDAKQRQTDVLNLMVEHGRITREMADAALAEPLKTYPSVNDVKSQAWIENQVEPALVRMCNGGVLPRLPNTANCFESVHSAGYKVTSSIDWGLTQQAQQMIAENIAAGLAAGCECYNAAIVTIEPTTGQVIVYAPNIDANNTTDKRINGDIDQLTEINQPGSSFKPAVYLAWFDYNTKHPYSVFWDTSPLPIEGTSFSIINPRSDGKTGEGLITARAALGGSQNVAAFRAAVEAGTDNVIEMAKKLGITTLEQGFDPTFRNHKETTYGPSIATGGANIRAIDIAYMNATLANMGTMVGVPHYATYVNPSTFKGTGTHEGADWELAREQSVAFSKGHIRLPGTRELDPVVILQVRDAEGNIIFTQGEPEKRQVVDAGSAWLLYSIQSDCDARFIIWGCGTSNDDIRLDAHMSNGTKIPMGIKTGTQQGPLDPNDTLETWMVGYSRYAATALWIGNANNDLVRDGPRANYASANTTIRLFKRWNGLYHDSLLARGVFSAPANFSSLQPRNVAQRSVVSPNTERGSAGGCTKFVTSWVRTDVRYDNPCRSVEIDTRNGLLATADTPQQFRVSREFPTLPSYKPDLALKLARELNLVPPTENSSGQAAVSIKNPGNGARISTDQVVIGSVSGNGPWRLEFGAGAAPGSWSSLGSGTGPVNDGPLGSFKVAGLAPGTYTIRLTSGTAQTEFMTSVSFNVEAPGTQTVTPGTGTPSVTTSPGPGTQTPTVPPTTTTPTPTQPTTPDTGGGNGGGSLDNIGNR